MLLNSWICYTYILFALRFFTNISNPCRIHTCSVKFCKPWMCVTTSLNPNQPDGIFGYPNKVFIIRMHWSTKSVAKRAPSDSPSPPPIPFQRSDSAVVIRLVLTIASSSVRSVISVNNYFRSKRFPALTRIIYVMMTGCTNSKLLHSQPLEM